MSNSKVRIYELSKELNLDNKDILEICEQLNITVKSHSSTITESQAERIKASAEKYTPSHSDKSHGSSPALTGRPAVAGPAKGERKQQILAIHHKQTRSPDEQVSNQAVSSTLANPPRPPVKPQSPTLSPPISRSSVPATLPTQERRKTDEKAQQAQPATPSRQTAKTPAKSATLPKLEAPNLLRPPSLESREVSQPMPRPVTKTDSAIATQAPTSLEIRPAKRGDKLAQEGGAKKTLAKSKGQLELHKPQLPKASPVELIESDEELPISDLELTDEEGLEEESLTRPKQKPTLKRPTPPRAAKKAVWEQEEEDEAKLQAKLGKGTGKGKRRNQAVLDDEDEEELESEMGAAALPTSVSLSIARPPKPKSAAKQPVAVSASKPKKAQPKAEATRVKAERRDRLESEQRPESISLGGSLTIRELADLLKVPETDIIKNLFFKGIAVNITQTLDLETARLVAEELGVTVETTQEKATAAKSTEMLDVADLENLQLRPPVVTIMGHVDHGKTTLLDSIRKTKVAQGEAGGITQHIGAYHVDVEHAGKSQQIVFLDTPGHEAFTAMRARGARVTDIAILVVAADDGVQPQTKEAISHARAAEVPIVVAINKIDKLDANPDRIKQELSELGLVPEEWGGDTIMVPVSALKGENLDNLLEMILLVAELEELSANPDRPAKGTVIEAHLDRTRGPVATLLVQNGTLRVGDIVVAGSVFGKIRAMIDDRGDKVEAATPSFAVEILGLNDVPAAGDEFDVYSNEKEARAIAEHRAEANRQSRLQQAMYSRRVTLTSLSAQAQEGELKELNLILKADVQGSVEAILGALQQLPQKEVQIRVLLSAPGEITETDVALAAASGAVIVGFNTTLASGARQIADQEGVDIREYDIIYKLLDDIQGAMEGLLEPEEIEEPLGQAEVRVVFPSGRGFVAGCYVLSGKVVRNRFVRVRRGGEVLYQGTLDSLKRFQEDAREVSAGYECGIGVPKFNDWKPGDIIEAYEMVMKRRTLSVR